MYSSISLCRMYDASRMRGLSSHNPPYFISPCLCTHYINVLNRQTDLPIACISIHQWVYTVQCMQSDSSYASDIFRCLEHRTFAVAVACMTHISHIIIIHTCNTTVCPTDNIFIHRARNNFIIYLYVTCNEIHHRDILTAFVQTELKRNKTSYFLLLNVKSHIVMILW